MSRRYSRRFSSGTKIWPWNYHISRSLSRSCVDSLANSASIVASLVACIFALALVCFAPNSSCSMPTTSHCPDTGPAHLPTARPGFSQGRRRSLALRWKDGPTLHLCILTSCLAYCRAVSTAHLFCPASSVESGLCSYQVHYNQDNLDPRNPWCNTTHL